MNEKDAPSDGLRVLVCGGRDYEDAEHVARCLDRLRAMRGEIALLIHGAARGADTLADQWARERKVTVESYPADWKRYGRSAGAIRNKQMLDDGRPHMPIKVKVVDDETLSADDMPTIICAPLQGAPIFSDNVIGECPFCGTKIQWRPTSLPRASHVCASCGLEEIAERMKDGDLPEIAVTKTTLREVAAERKKRWS